MRLLQSSMPSFSQSFPLAFALCAAAVFSATILGLQVLYSTSIVRRFLHRFSKPRLNQNALSNEPTKSRDYSHKQANAKALVLYDLLRLGACIAVSVLTALELMLFRDQDEANGTQYPSGKTYLVWLAVPSIYYAESFYVVDAVHQPALLICVFYIYSTLLATLTLTIAARFRTIVNIHLTSLLLLAFIVHICLDLVPLTLSTHSPIVPLTPWLTWTRFATLGFAAAIIPACTPRQYAPLDPKSIDPPNPEQTASLFSLISYRFLNSLVWKAYRARKLPYKELPPLADYDRAEYLKQRSFDQLDPFRMKKKRHLFLGLMYVFRKDYYVMATMIIVKSFMDFTGPLGIRFLLKYLSDPSDPGLVRPWVWVFWLFVGPIIGSLAIEWYKFVATPAATHAEGMLTQLVFEHTLRIRMTANHDGQKNIGGSNLVGKITNLMSTDLKNITEGCDFLLVILSAPIQIIVGMVFLYKLLGWSAIVGTAVMLVSMLIPVKLARLISDTQAKRMKKTDARVQSLVESINLIRMIKMFAWEKKIQDQVREKREEELHWYKKQRYLSLANAQMNSLIPIAVMISTYTAYTLWMKQPLDASIVFSSITVFDILRGQLQRLLWQLPSSIQARVSLIRVNDFLNHTELLDAYSGKTRSNPNVTLPFDHTIIGFRNANFTWAAKGSEPQSTPQRNFTLRIDGELLFHPGKINVITGPTGSGKTSLLMALLGEMHFVPTSQDSWFSLPREDGVAYAAQEAWIQSGTIRDNILFGSEYDEQRYKKVLSQCALEQDLALLDTADEAEVGERGITLSGGQKARVSLARAVYSKAAVLILDDVLSALDGHTSRRIVDQCLKGDLIQGRTVIFVTHNVAMASEVSDFVVLLGPEGRIASQGVAAEIFRVKPDFDVNTEGIEENPKQFSGPKAMKSTTRNKTSAEELAEGHIGWPALSFFFASLGRTRFWSFYLLGSFLVALGTLLQTYWLGIWAREYNLGTRISSQVNTPFYLSIYAAICALVTIMFSLTFTIYVKGSVRASHRIHNRLLAFVLGAPLRWFDFTPSGRITSRFTQDMRSIDGALPNALQKFVDLTIQLGLRLVAIVIFSPVFLFPGILLLAIGIWIGRIYITAQLWVKRETSNARSPVFSHFGAALAGITTIRAYGAEELFRTEAMCRINNYTRAARSFYNLNRWICVRMDTLGALFSGSLAAYLVYRQTSTPDASDTGFSLNMAIAFSGGILWWVRNLNEFEVQSNSLERIQDYVTIEQEPDAVPEKVPPAYWPASGALVIDNLVARYSPDGPAVLHGLSFEIKSGERVGVIGRTGSGKSSLTLSLLRMIPIEGNVYYDGIPTHALNLDALRSNITIIPQQPELMSGTVRQNLDPFSEHNDAVLYSALQSAGLNTLQTEGNEGYIGLDTGVSAGGSNFSLGQRQIIALARAVVRRSKVLILDEATAAIDYKTDSAIQHLIRTELKDVTLIIIAHRLQTICDADKVMVLDAGKVIEFNSPAALLEKERGAFKLLVDQSGDRDLLYAMARDKIQIHV